VPPARARYNATPDPPGGFTAITAIMKPTGVSASAARPDRGGDSARARHRLRF